MLIKRKNLSHIKNISTANIVEISEATKVARTEIQKARQEAKAIQQEAQVLLTESQKKLKEAEAKANEIVQSARLEAKKIKEKTYNDTLQKANDEAELIKAKARELLKELFEVKRSALTQAHNEIISIALDMAEKILRYQASIDSTVLKTQIIESIKKATSEGERIKVSVNPSDLKTLEENLSDIEKLFPSGMEIVALSNDSINPGSCIIETKSGQLDASFSAQLAALKDLVTHLEIKKPEIEIDQVAIEEKLTEPQIEEEQLKKELLGDEPLIELPKDEEETQDLLIAEDIEIEKKEDKLQEVDISKETPKKKKLNLDEDLLERTQEEINELDETEITVEDNLYGFEDEEEPEEDISHDTASILRPKKQDSQEVSKIAEEIETKPEWQSLLQDEDG